MATVAEMTLRALVRRRASLALFVLLPLVFYLARHGQPWQSVRFLGIGLAWAASSLALFGTLAACTTEPRLRVAGWSWRALLAGRVAALLGLTLALALAYYALVAIDQPIGDTAAIGLMLAVTACTGVAVGTALGTLVARDLEGALLLFIVAGLQVMVDPAGTLAHLLPFWSTREIATAAIEGSGTGSITDGLVHTAIVLFLCAILTIALTARQLHTSSRFRTNLPPVERST